MSAWIVSTVLIVATVGVMRAAILIAKRNERDWT